MEFSRQEYWSGLPFPSPGNLPDPEIEPGSPALQADSLPSEPPGKPKIYKEGDSCQNWILLIQRSIDGPRKMFRILTKVWLGKESVLGLELVSRQRHTNPLPSGVAHP